MKNTTKPERPTGCTGNCCQGRFCDCAPNVDQIDDDAHLYLLERPFARWPVAAPLVVLAALFGLIMFLEWLEMNGGAA